DVGEWLSRFWGALCGEPTGRDRVRRSLVAAQRDGARLELEPLAAAAEPPTAMLATIQRVRQTDMIISQPTTGGRNRILTTGETLHLRFFGPEGGLGGNTTCRGRIKIPPARCEDGENDDGGRTFYGYCLTLPESLVPESRRTERRHAVDRALDVEVELRCFDQFGPVRGIVKDISSRGLEIRSYNAKDKLAEGQRVYLKVELPPPIGLLTEMVIVDRLSPGANKHQLIVGLLFPRPIKALTEFLEQDEEAEKDKPRKRKAG
ncbi:MAG: PilZ domain-containing protein, partial [Planctomycetota bacterium]